MPTVRWTVGKGVCVSAATAAERAEEPAVTHGLSFSFTIHLASVVDAAVFRRFVKRPYGGICYRVPLTLPGCLLFPGLGGAEPRPYIRLSFLPHINSPCLFIATGLWAAGRQ